jgi:hypothetical protein
VSIKERVKANSLPSLGDESTAQKIAKQSNVSHQTVKNAEKFADAVDKVSEEKDGLQRGVRLSFLNMSGVFRITRFLKLLNGLRFKRYRIRKKRENENP